MEEAGFEQLTLGKDKVVGANELAKGVRGEDGDGRVLGQGESRRGRQKGENLLDLHLVGE